MLRMAILLGMIMLAVFGRDYYDILGLDRSADKKSIKKAYRNLSKSHHPDKNPGNKAAHQEFLEIGEAYQVLSDDEKRRVYDQYGKDGLKDNHFHDPFEMFSNFNNGHGGRGKRGPSMRSFADVSLEEVFHGTSYSIQVNKQIICPKCRGTGAKDPDSVKVCSTCKGSGVRMIQQQVMPGFYQTFQVACEKCNGKGKVVKEKCPACSGHKVQRGSNTLTVSIERGMWDGYELVFEGESEQHPDYSSGNLIVTVRVSDHPLFRRDGHHLYTRQVLSLKEALLGFKRDLVHLSGETLTISRDVPTQHGIFQLE